MSAAAERFRAHGLALKESALDYVRSCRDLDLRYPSNVRSREWRIKEARKVWRNGLWYIRHAELFQETIDV